MAFFYNSVTKTFLFAPRETPPYVPGAPDEPSFGLIRDGDLGARDCCCCPCCAVPEGSQIYVCTNDTKKRRCINDGGTPNCSTPTCQPDTCCNGACCQGTSCSIKADVVCQQLGGVFKGCGTTCGGGICNPPPPCIAPCLALPGNPTVTAILTITTGEGSSCPGENVTLNLTVGRLPFSPFYGAENVPVGGVGTASIYLRCDYAPDGWYSYAAFTGCTFENGQWTGGQTAFKTHQAATVNGQCRVQGDSNYEGFYEGFGLTISYTMQIAYP